MSLHGSINVGDNAVGAWVARRTTYHRLTTNTYECDVQWFTPNGIPLRHTFTLNHDYDDGAMVLAAKVLAHVAGLD